MCGLSHHDILHVKAQGGLYPKCNTPRMVSLPSVTSNSDSDGRCFCVYFPVNRQISRTEIPYLLISVSWWHLFLTGWGRTLNRQGPLCCASHSQGS